MKTHRLFVLWKQVTGKEYHSWLWHRGCSSYQTSAPPLDQIIPPQLADSAFLTDDGSCSTVTLYAGKKRSTSPAITAAIESRSHVGRVVSAPFGGRIFQGRFFVLECHNPNDDFISLTKITAEQLGVELEHHYLNRVALAAAILEDSALDDIVDRLRAVVAGRRPMAPEVGKAVLADEAGRVTVKKLQSLTSKEREVMRFVSEGLTNREIGWRMCLGEGTIKTHLHHIFEKTGLKNRTSLAAMALRLDD
jgi:DNA-binding CsgD family transcriptional regulator